MVLNKDYTKIDRTKLVSPKKKESEKSSVANKNEIKRNVLFKVEFKVSENKIIDFEVLADSDIHADLFEFFEQNKLDTLMVLPFYCQINQAIAEMMLDTREKTKPLTLKRFGSMENKIWDDDI